MLRQPRFGTEKLSDGRNYASEYVGNWVDDVQKGKGKMTFGNGDECVAGV